MKTREVTDKLQDWQKRISDTARQAGKATDDYVHENAWTSIALAAVFGCIIGYLLGNRGD